MNNQTQQSPTSNHRLVELLKPDSAPPKEPVIPVHDDEANWNERLRRIGAVRCGGGVRIIRKRVGAY